MAGSNLINRESIQFLIVVMALATLMFMANRLAQNPAANHPKLQFKQGDDLNWAHGSTTTWSNEFPDTTIFWVKADLSSVNLDTTSRLEVIVELLGTYQVYLNQQLINENGSFNTNPHREIPGLSYHRFMVPAITTPPGDSILYLRVVRSQIDHNYGLIRVTIGGEDKLSREILINTTVIHFIGGIFFIVSIYYAFLYFISYRKTEFLLFSLVCFISFLLIVVAFSKSYFSIPYHHYVYRYWIFRTLSFLISVLLPVFLIYFFKIPYKKHFILALTSLLIICWSLPHNFSWLVYLIGFGSQFGFTLWAITQRQSGSIEVLVGLLTFVMGFIYFNMTIYLGFSILVVAMLFSLSKTTRDERRKQNEAQLRSSRLEVELLRKKIQPHFLMNTLTTIISLIESAPKTSIKLIEALSDEFHALNRISHKKVIPITEEIALCNSYLKVMSIRNDIKYELQTDLNGAGYMIPPAIFHTIIENGISHNHPIDGKMKFRISHVDNNERVVFYIQSFGIVDLKNLAMVEGTGVKYIKARLEECYSERWRLDFDIDQDMWQTIIEINKL